MPIWLASALALLRTGGIRTATTARRLAVPGAIGVGGGFLGGALGDDDDRPRRRRRRRALTASDRADISFVAGILGPKAGKDFAVTLIAGLTR